MDVSTTEQLHILSRLLIAGGLGAFIGLEREVRGYPAGVRTIAIVAVGAALFTNASVLFGDEATSRVASNIVVGIGFLGAGVIMREEGSIHGMTTAATIWAAAAIGMAVGLSLYVVAVPAAAFVVLLLEARPLTTRIDGALRSMGLSLREDEDNRPLPRDDRK